ncbi:e3 ubiquitin-protein ligase kcmf1 [Holotrichia oblita]|uniref:E3 ubiquitin-protein ligase kcmf1 n=1 Tax=Holotrichia oblita TaxID=644536 RepID=A0ACB9TNP2_HOLOL|nr:e3 ubiquitin-protein ligase kcmf1 [Holotrichia oblita]
MSLLWKKVEDEKGFPYYVNEQTKAKQWDHPKFTDIKQKLDECNWIKYSAYRVAFKFRTLQNTLCMDDIPLSIIAGVFERHRLNAIENCLYLETYDIEAILSDIYFASSKQNHTNIDIDLAIELMINFLYNIYDKNRTGCVQVLHVKLVLSLLCKTNLNSLYHYLFSLCADHNNCVTRLKSPGLVGINESMFIAWLETNPQLLLWLPTVHRLKKSETTVHSSKCSVCKANPIVGLKYRCVKCSRYIQCQKCYFTAKISHSHKISHQMREYCVEDTSNDTTRHLIKKLCGLLRCSVQNNETNIIETNPLRIDRDWISKSKSENALCDVEPMSSPHMQLQVVIRQLEIQNRELQQILLLSRSTDNIKTYLEDHRQQVAAQIHKLKLLKDCLKNSTVVEPVTKLYLESTPMVPTYKSKESIDMLSPIAQSKSTLNLSDQIDLFGAKGRPNSFSNSVQENKVPMYEMHSDLDDALAKLQQILANNFTLDESLGSLDNGQLKNAVTEVEGMLTSLIDNVEGSRASSTQPLSNQKRETDIYDRNYMYS